jgi:hypothetical protein
VAYTTIARGFGVLTKLGLDTDQVPFHGRSQANPDPPQLDTIV